MRRISQIRSDISRSVERFLKSKNPAMRHLRNEVVEPLEHIGEVAIVGGLVRDIVRYGIDQRPISDIDLVIQGSPSAVANIARTLSAKPNRFGGFGVISAHYKADFWALSTTWARTNGGLRISRIQDLLDSTFFNWDAIVYSTASSTTYFKDEYLEDIRNHVLEINFGETASHKGNLIRALRRLVAWQAEPGPKLRDFLERGFSFYSWNEILEQERLAFYNQYLGRFYDAGDYLKHLEGEGGERFLPVQLSLFQHYELPIHPSGNGTSWTDYGPQEPVGIQKELSI